MTIVPDAIEPYVGYKALHVHDNNGTLTLTSPSYVVTWPKQQRHEAACNASPQDWGWKPVRSYARQLPQPEEEEEEGFSFNNTAPFLIGGTRARITQKPQTILPDGMDWSWEPVPHQTANQNCSCGIYVVDAPGECVSYIHPPASVICKIALWGNVTRATHGARGQYAYPQTIEYAMGLDNHRIVHLANEYGLQLPESEPSSIDELIQQHLQTPAIVWAPLQTLNTINDFTITTTSNNTKTWMPYTISYSWIPPLPNQIWE